jgi:hypothetical protein
MAKTFTTIGDEHWYPSKAIEDKWYPSVTTILKAYPKGVGFERYLANQESYEASQVILKAAGSRGTNVHDATELLEAGQTLLRTNYTDEEWKMLIGFTNFHKDMNPEIIMSEQSIVSDNFMTGGTIDRVYKIDGEYVLLDFKTSKAIHKNYWLQVSIYFQLFMESRHLLGLEHITPTKTAILRLAPGKKAGYEYVTHDIDELMEDYMAFSSLYSVWRYDNPDAKPKFDTLPDVIALEYNSTITNSNSPIESNEKTTIDGGVEIKEDQTPKGNRVKRSKKEV